MEKEKATHFRILGWRLPRTEEPGGVQSIGLQTTEHNRATKTFIFKVIKKTNRKRHIGKNAKKKEGKICYINSRVEEEEKEPQRSTNRWFNENRRYIRAAQHFKHIFKLIWAKRPKECV